MSYQTYEESTKFNKQLLQDFLTTEVRKRWNSLLYNPEGTISKKSIIDGVKNDFIQIINEISAV